MSLIKKIKQYVNGSWQEFNLDPNVLSEGGGTIDLSDYSTTSISLTGNMYYYLGTGGKETYIEGAAAGGLSLFTYDTISLVGGNAVNVTAGNFNVQVSGASWSTINMPIGAGITLTSANDDLVLQATNSNDVQINGAKVLANGEEIATKAWALSEFGGSEAEYIFTDWTNDLITNQTDLSGKVIHFDKTVGWNYTPWDGGVYLRSSGGYYIHVESMGPPYTYLFNASGSPVATIYQWIDGEGGNEWATPELTLPNDFGYITEMLYGTNWLNNVTLGVAEGQPQIEIDDSNYAKLDSENTFTGTNLGVDATLVLDASANIPLQYTGGFNSAAFKLINGMGPNDSMTYGLHDITAVSSNSYNASYTTKLNFPQIGSSTASSANYTLTLPAENGVLATQEWVTANGGGGGGSSSTTSASYVGSNGYSVTIDPSATNPILIDAGLGTDNPNGLKVCSNMMYMDSAVYKSTGISATIANDYGNSTQTVTNLKFPRNDNSSTTITNNLVFPNSSGTIATEEWVNGALEIVNDFNSDISELYNITNGQEERITALESGGGGGTMYSYQVQVIWSANSKTETWQFYFLSSKNSTDIGLKTGITFAQFISIMTPTLGTCTAVQPGATPRIVGKVTTMNGLNNGMMIITRDNQSSDLTYNGNTTTINMISIYSCTAI